MTEFRSGFVAIMGRPNVGKSTLVNALLGQKIAAVSPKPQTTRRRQLGILTTRTAQVVFVDTPGLHAARHKLGEFLNQEAQESLEDVDAVIFLVDAAAEPAEEDRSVAQLLGRLPRRIRPLLVLNKIDLLTGDKIEARADDYGKLLEGAQLLKVSARTGTGLVDLIQALTGSLPVRPPEYPEDQVTDSYGRDIAADLVREAALLKLRDEVPHGIAVRIDEFDAIARAGFQCPTLVHPSAWVEPSGNRIALAFRCQDPDEVDCTYATLVGKGYAVLLHDPNIDMERVLAMHPDMVLVWPSGTPDSVIEQLRRLGLRVESVPTYRLSDVPAALRRIGAIAGSAELAEQAAQRFERDVAAQPFVDHPAPTAVHPVPAPARVHEAYRHPRVARHDKRLDERGVEPLFRDAVSVEHHGVVLLDIETVLRRRNGWKRRNQGEKQEAQCGRPSRVWDHSLLSYYQSRETTSTWSFYFSAPRAAAKARKGRSLRASWAFLPSRRARFSARN